MTPARTWIAALAAVAVFASAGATPGASDTSQKSRVRPAKAARVSYVVRGRISRPDGAPVAGVRVQAYDRGSRGETTLGQATTDGSGQYQVRFRSTEPLTLVVRVFARTGQEIGASEARTNPSSTVTLDLAVDDTRGTVR